MNKNRLLFTVISCFMVLQLSAQLVNTKPSLSYKASGQLDVTINKTTHLVFPEAIVSIDRGSTDILVQKAEGSDHILRVKAAVKAFAETNLSVITKGGRLYSFVVCYSSEPRYYNLQVSKEELQPAAAPLLQDEPWEWEQKILGQAPNCTGPGANQAGVSLRLTGMYQQEGSLYMRLRVENRSNLEFRSDKLRLFIRDRKGNSHTATQERELFRSHLYRDEGISVKGQDSKEVVLPLHPLTLPKGKYLALEAAEKGGGRHLVLKVKNRHLLQCETLRVTSLQ